MSEGVQCIDQLAAPEIPGGAEARILRFDGQPLGYNFGGKALALAEPILTGAVRNGFLERCFVHDWNIPGRSAF